ncbi:hypothetical protein BKH43_06970 [Helicobacter sp. 13S00401-1]|uniref:hypothetical protein n=1 Tax=Helicobacter sp. 13S00401-1 TaxID=1905758 RepID=UPI000BA6D284|nr:hypothetical protein [Helicobacter sp. 13S00401-1]PAF49317.1 hypothetical protein BKH43_06970 [Helicobacter sp. 13S00401-1]
MAEALLKLHGMKVKKNATYYKTSSLLIRNLALELAFEIVHDEDTKTRIKGSLKYLSTLTVLHD